MDRTNISQNLRALRAQSGMTQEEVASHLKVTKAAVSKWECDQSLPEITLLPSIAELYSVTIDELFEHTGKVSEEEIDVLSKKIAALFRESADEALSYVQEQARKHWSDSSVLKTLALTTFSCLPQLDGSQDKPVVGKAYECVVVMERLYRRIISLQPDGEAAQDDLSFLASLLLMLGKEDEVVEIIEPFIPHEPNTAPMLLASLFAQNGQNDQAIELVERALLISLIDACSRLQILSNLWCGDEERIGEIVKLAQHLQYSENRIVLFPTLLPSVYYDAARSALMNNDADAGLDRLDALAQCLKRSCEVMAYPSIPLIFNEVRDLLWVEGTPDVEKARCEACQKYALAYSEQLKTDAIWESVRGDERFAKVISEIEGV